MPDATISASEAPIKTVNLLTSLSAANSIDATNKWPGETQRQCGQPINMDSEVINRVDGYWDKLWE